MEKICYNILIISCRGTEKVKAMANEASQFTQKDELISKFYLLRAGLSVIAEETNKIKTAEAELADLVAKNEENNAEVLKKYDPQIDSHNADYNRFNALTPYVSKHDLDAINEHKASIRYAVVPGIIACFLCSPINALLPPLGLLAYIVLVSVAAIGWRKMVTKKERDKLRALAEQNAKEAFEKAEVNKKQLSQQIQELEKEKQEKLDIYLLDIQNYKTKLDNEIIPTAVSAARSVKKSMLETSQGIIEETDWSNLDLLIFYLETGRADSLKEALLLVDQQRQTDQLCAAIDTAKNHICETISRSIERLGAQLAMMTNQLSNQIQANHEQSMSLMNHSFLNLGDMISSGNAAVSAKLGEITRNIQKGNEQLVSAEKLNASLLKNAKESCDTLVSELKYNQSYWG